MCRNSYSFTVLTYGIIFYFQMSSEGNAQSVLMVCLGNICRSPIAAHVFKHLAKEKGVESQWLCDSAGTGGWHVGEDMDPRSASTLRKHKIEPVHTVRQITKADFKKFDFIFGMDNENIRDLKQKAPSGSKAQIELLSSYDPEGAKIIRDPYYDRDLSGFEDCYQIAYRSCSAFLDKFSKK